MAVKTSIGKKVELFNLAAYIPDPKLFKPLSTGKEGLDQLISDDRGFMPGTSIFCAGGPGSGKTTIGTDAMAAIMERNPDAKCAYLNSEMKPLDLASERRKRKCLDKLKNIFLMSQHENPKEALERFLMMGWDFIVVDSFKDIQTRLRGFVPSDIPGYLLKLFSTHNDDLHKTGYHTCFFIIQHVTKDGTFKGGTELEHDTTAFIHLDKDEEGNRFIWASKNRRAPDYIDRKLYFKLVDGVVEYDIERWDKDSEMGLRFIEEKKRLEKEGSEFFETIPIRVYSNTEQAN